MNLKLRSVTLDDAEAILNIYRNYIENTAITFEHNVPSPEEFRTRIETISQKFPYIAATIDDKLVGYTYAGTFKARAGYDWSVESSIYVDPTFSKRGIGRTLYAKLAEALTRMGIVNIYACVAYASEPDEYVDDNSLDFHQHMGFVKVGEFPYCAYKFNRWYSTIWLVKTLGDHIKGQPAVSFNPPKIY